MNNILSLITYTYLPPTDGGRNGIYFQHKYFAKHANFMAIGVANNKADEAINYKLLPIFSNSKWRYINIINVFKIIKIIKQQNIDILLFQHPYIGWMLPFFKIFTKVKFALRSHNVEYLRFKDFNKPWWPIMKVYEKWVHNSIDYLLCVTEVDRAFYKKQGIKSKLIDLPYGTELNAFPTTKLEFKNKLATLHQFDSVKKIILFNGSLGYAPNRLGLEILVNQVYPELEKLSKNYVIIICGGGLKDGFEKLKNNEYPNIIYCGFVQDINQYFLAADIFVNPVHGGGGVKTKLIEALAFGCTVVSSNNGAIGVVEKVCEQKLFITKDYDAFAMTLKLNDLLNESSIRGTPQSFYEYYNWDSILKRVVKELL